MVAENRLGPEDFILPIFVQEPGGTSDISAMPGVQRIRSR